MNLYHEQKRGQTAVNATSQFEWKTVKCQEGTWKTFGGELDATCSNDEAGYLVINVITMLGCSSIKKKISHFCQRSGSKVNTVNRD